MFKKSIFDNWNKEIYIAKKLRVELDDYGNEINIYDTPQKYVFNVQPLSGYNDITTYGEKVSKMYKAVIDSKYLGQFSEGDVAYLEGKTPLSEPKNGYNANYIIDSVRFQNLTIAIYFNKLQQ